MGIIKEKYKNILNYIIDFCKYKSMYLYFIALFLGIALFYGLCFFVDESYFKSVIFYNPKDPHMDFYNCIAGYGGNPYGGEVGTNYPPLAVIIFKVFRRLVPEELFSLWSGELRGYSLPILSFVLYNFVILWLVFISINNKIKDVRLRNFLMLVLPISAPVIFAIERGNIVNLSFAFTLFFVCFYDSENKFIKEMALIALAIAAGIKIYPAIFGLMLLKHGKKSECIRLLIYGIVIFFAPFWFFGGIPAIASFIRGLMGFVSSRTSAMVTMGLDLASAADLSFTVNDAMIMMPEAYGYNFSYNNICLVIETIMGIDISNAISFVILAMIVIVLLFGVYAFKEKWQEQLCLLLILILVPPANIGYILLFALIPFIELMCTQNEQKRTLFLPQESGYLFCMLLLLIPWALPNVKFFSNQNEQLSASFLLYFLCVVSMTVVTAVEVILLYVHNKKAEKNIRRVIFAITILISSFIMYKSMI